MTEMTKSFTMIIAVHPPNRQCQCRVEVSAPSLFGEEFQADQNSLVIENYAILN